MLIHTHKLYASIETDIFHINMTMDVLIIKNPENGKLEPIFLPSAII